MLAPLIVASRKKLKGESNTFELMNEQGLDMTDKAIVVNNSIFEMNLTPEAAKLCPRPFSTVPPIEQQCTIVLGGVQFYAKEHSIERLIAAFTYLKSQKGSERVAHCDMRYSSAHWRCFAYFDPEETPSGEKYTIAVGDGVVINIDDIDSFLSALQEIKAEFERIRHENFTGVGS